MVRTILPRMFPALYARCASAARASGKVLRDRAERAQVIVLGLAGGTDHLGPPQLGQLHRDGADRAGGAVNQDRIALADFQLSQCDVRGLRPGAEPAGHFPGHIRRLRGDLVTS